ncbi:ABC transporter [Thalassospira profundimaris]|uniref:ABC transporter n=1 Tax=Thalassospira profundimaris TaxID=502049 RepID=A0A367WYR7_9PROT|nr:ATP-binding cassette domain-containing protein [Thalassospira profundimaris]RCK46537.1 ABC transporter [Thalassospira profundimaris]
MKALWKIFRFILRDQRSAMLRGAALSLVVLAMGAALLGLSGWFITAAAAAGLAGAGAVFDVFRPSAMVRFLALGRAAARYGERMLTHDATLRALETLRARVLATYLAAPYPRMIRIRGAQALNRLTADIDALDGVSLRLVLPVMAGLFTLMLAFVVLWWLVTPAVAFWVAGGYVLAGIVVFGWMARISLPLSWRAEISAQAFRTRLIDLIAARRDLAVYGRLAAQKKHVQTAETRHEDIRRQLDRRERQTGALLAITGTIVTAGALGLGIMLVQSGQIGPAFAALGFFAALALAEPLAPVRRAVSDFGRMAVAARRIGSDLSEPAPLTTAPSHVPDQNPDQNGDLHITNLTLNRAGASVPIISSLSFTVSPGETLAVTGPSGRGKSTLLLAIAGLHPVATGHIRIADRPITDWAESDLRRYLTLLPQRSALMAGTVGDALQLAGPVDDAHLWRLLSAVQLDHIITQKGGLSAKIGSRGEGLSGGEARRLVLARALAKNPKILLLDEPTEGLDEATSVAVLRGIREVLPDAVIVIAAHKKPERSFADRILELK